MPKYHLDEVARLDDIEALITTTQDLVRRLNVSELGASARCLADSLHEVRQARAVLIAKWRALDSAGNHQ